MKTIATKIFIAVFVMCFISMPVAQAKGDDFKSVVKLIEQFYGVKHEGIPFLGKAAMKVVGTAARIKGGQARHLAEAGSIKLAIFEDQTFTGDFIKFRASLNAALSETWTPLVQTLSSNGEEQVYLFVREADQKFNVLVITIEQREATVVQINVSPKNLVQLMQDPEGSAKSIREEATIDQE